MTAQTLRDAAKVLRKRAEKATPGPWLRETYGNGFGPLVIGDEMAVAETFDKPHLSDATYIATMHPGVGLALADWLNTAGADLWAYGPLCCDDGCDECDDELWSPHVRRALTVARAILGSDA